MAYGTLPYHESCFKASHNSYERDEDLHEQLRWNASQPAQGGCRGLELGLSLREEGHGVLLHQAAQMVCSGR